MFMVVDSRKAVGGFSLSLVDMMPDSASHGDAFQLYVRIITYNVDSNPNKLVRGSYDFANDNVQGRLD